MFFFQKAFFFLLVAGCWLMSSINSQPTYNYHYCLDQSNETPDTSFQSNLSVLLDSLSSKASQNNSFYNDTSNGIYSLFLCRGDINSSICQSCVSYATQDITSRCPSNRTATIGFDQCMLRYSDTNFFGMEQTSPELLAWNTIGNTTSPDEANFGALALMNGLIDEALGTDMLFKAGNRAVGGGSEVRYGLVQCTRDINTTSCSNCLGQLMNDANQCCQQKQGWRILAPSCNIRYENYLFFQKPPVPPSPQPVPAAPQPPPDNGKAPTKFGLINMSM
jgi:hypothetical protein